MKKYNFTYVPARSSYIRIPRDQKSTALSCPLFNIISGATYSGVPQKVQVFSPGIRNLENPKSTIFTYPSQSRFQNFKIKKCHEPNYESSWSFLVQKIVFITNNLKNTSKIFNYFVYSLQYAYIH